MFLCWYYHLGALNDNDLLGVSYIYLIMNQTIEYNKRRYTKVYRQCI
nr:MAG TPA: hypothetical protein [Caudoviricetes sp.]